MPAPDSFSITADLTTSIQKAAKIGNEQLEHQKVVKLTPGPCDYQLDPLRAKTKNYLLMS